MVAFLVSCRSSKKSRSSIGASARAARSSATGTTLPLDHTQRTISCEARCDLSWPPSLGVLVFVPISAGDGQNSAKLWGQEALMFSLLLLSTMLAAPSAATQPATAPGDLLAVEPTPLVMMRHELPEQMIEEQQQQPTPFDAMEIYPEGD